MSSVFRYENASNLVISYADNIYVCENYKSDILNMTAIRKIFGSVDGSYLRTGWTSEPWEYLNHFWETTLVSAQEIGGLLILNFKSEAKGATDDGPSKGYVDIDSRIEFRMDIVRTLEHMRMLLKDLRKEHTALLEYRQPTVQTRHVDETPNSAPKRRRGPSKKTSLVSES
jgi:hypothetical protein